MKRFFEEMFFSPKWYHLFIILLLLPLSLLYGTGMVLRRLFTRRKDFGIPIVSVGNLIVGGAGKTPFVIALVSKYEGAYIISRGYGRLYRGLIEVSHKGKVLVSVEESGDEAMLMARSLPNASVIVSEDRHKAIELAKKRGARILILDDGFNRMDIKKYEILLEPACIKNYLPFPAGAFREFWFVRRYADIVVKEGRDFERVVEIVNPSKRMLLVTAISNPQRLERYLPKNVVGKVYLDDHAYFDKKTLINHMKAYQATSILCTSKDKVKLDNFDFLLSEMKLKLTINDAIMAKIDVYIEGHKDA